MKKNLLVLALPMLLLAACNKNSGPNEGPVSFKKFQLMAYNTLSRGIMEQGTFTVLYTAYQLDIEGQKTDNIDYEHFGSFNYIVNGQEIYYQEGGSSLEYILDLQNNSALWKVGSNWVNKDIAPTNTEGYLWYVASVGASSNQLTDKKNGKYKSNTSLINYEYKRLDTSGVFKYRCEYDLEEMKLTNINRGYYDSSLYYEVEIKNISYTGEIPEH